MPYLGGSDVTLPEAPPVELRGKVRNRFYEPIVLILALTQTLHNRPQKQLEHAPDETVQTQEQLFHDFINKLAQICDNKCGGNTVTSAVALQYPDRVQYRFASNQRKEGDLVLVKSFIQEILNVLSTWTDAESTLVRATVLRKVVAFNRPRLQVYVRAIRHKSQECLNTPMGSISTQTREKLQSLRELSLEADDRELEEKAFFKNCTELMLSIKVMSKSEAYNTLREKANAENGQTSPWGELRHAAGRLLSYLQGVNALLSARKKWDCLFHDFEVVWLPSSTALPNPISRKRVTSQEIIGRMTSDPEKAARYRRSAQDLQHMGLDNEIRDQAMSKNFCPIVHAEILNHESIINDPDLKSLHPSKFFNGYRYIGSSKPTCRLCDYYFSVCADNIETRRTHRNIYANWRVPNVYQGQGDEAVKRREAVLNKMLVRIREDGFHNLDDKVSERRQHDSFTDPTYNHGTSVRDTDGGNEDISETLAQLTIEYSDVNDPASEAHHDQEGQTEADEEDDDEGGVRL